jgi:hypothetical protein
MAIEPVHLELNAVKVYDANLNSVQLRAEEARPHEAIQFDGKCVRIVGVNGLSDKGEPLTLLREYLAQVGIQSDGLDVAAMIQRLYGLQKQGHVR